MPPRIAPTARHDTSTRRVYVATVLRVGPYQVYFYSHEPRERPHVHIDRDDRSAKFWIDPVELAHNHGFRAHELGRIRRIVNRHAAKLLEAWDEFFGR